MDHVWIVTRWICGGGGDDDREILAVSTEAEKAYAVAREIGTDAQVTAYPLDAVISRT